MSTLEYKKYPRTMSYASLTLLPIAILSLALIQQQPEQEEETRNEDGDDEEEENGEIE